MSRQASLCSQPCQCIGGHTKEWNLVMPLSVQRSLPRFTLPHASDSTACQDCSMFWGALRDEEPLTLTGICWNLSRGFMCVRMVKRMAPDFGNLLRVSLSIRVHRRLPAFPAVMGSSCHLLFKLMPALTCSMSASSSGWNFTGLSLICRGRG